MTERSPARRSRRATATLLLVGALSGLAALAGLRLVPPAQHPMGPATLSVRGDLGPGRTTLLVPPLGTISADTHVSPLGLSLTITEVDPNRLGRAVSGETPRDALVEDIEGDLRATAQRAAVQLVIGGVILGGIVAALLPRRRWTSVAAGAAGGGVMVGAVLVLTAATFDVESFTEPRFTGTLRSAPEVIEILAEGVGSVEELGSRYASAADRLSELLALSSQPGGDFEEDSVAILHVSDIHSNPVGIQIVDQLARRFEVDAVIDTGDVTSFGQPVEGRIGDLISEVPVPYLYAPGNHDSAVNRNRLSQVDNVTLLDGEVAEVAGIEVLGWADPTFTASEEITTDEGNALRAAAATEVAASVEDHAPDVLAVHDARLAEESIGDVPLVLAGHTHERGLELLDGTTLMTVGSTGATGLGSFIVEADLSYEAQIIYFRGGRPVTYDYISFSGLAGDFEVERRTLEGGG